MGLVSAASISSSSIHSVYVGLYLNTASSNTIVSNVIANHNQRGIDLVASDANTLLSNVIFGNVSVGRDAFVVHSGDNNYINGNRVFSNQSDGIYLDSSAGSSDFNYLSNNLAYNNNYS